jgi:hypothetical protein
MLFNLRAKIIKGFFQQKIFLFVYENKYFLLIRRIIIKTKNMPVISSKEFAINQKKYLDLAMSRDVYVKRGKNKFVVSNANGHDEFLEPDDDFRRALSADEFREQLVVVLNSLDKKYANKCK